MSLSRLFLIIGLSAPSLGFAAFDLQTLSPTANALNGAYSALGEDPWAILYNPAQIVRLEDSQASFSYARPGIHFSGLEAHALSGIFARNSMNVAYGLGINLLNTNVYYREISGILSLGERWGEPEENWDIAAGTNLKIYSLRRGEPTQTNDPALAPKTLNRFTLDIGLHLRVQKIFFGLSLINALPANIGFVNSEKIHPELRLGIGIERFWEFSNRVKISPLIELVPKTDAKDIITGAKIHFQDHLQLNFGVDKNRAALGCTFHLPSKNSEGKKLRFSFSYQIPIQGAENQGAPLFGTTFIF